jgi:hypothetical protein
MLRVIWASSSGVNRFGSNAPTFGVSRTEGTVGVRSWTIA